MAGTVAPVCGPVEAGTAGWERAGDATRTGDGAGTGGGASTAGSALATSSDVGTPGGPSGTSGGVDYLYVKSV